MVPAGVCRAGVAPLLGSVRRALAAETSRVLPAVRGLVCSRALVPQPLRSSMWAATARPHAPSRAPAVKSMPVRRMVSAEHGATVDGSELDPYLPHRVNLEKAKEYIKANVSEGMSRDEVAEVVKQAMELHIPPVPSLEELQQQEESAQKLEKQQRLQKDLKRSKEEALRRDLEPLHRRSRASALMSEKAMDAGVEVKVEKWSFATGDCNMWRRRFSEAASSPAVSKDGATIFVGSDDHKVYALDAWNGSLKWSHCGR